VRVLSRRFRDLFVQRPRAAYAGGRLRLPGVLAALADPAAFAARAVQLGRSEWVVFAKPPFAGPEPVLGYLARYTHRVAIANSRLVGLEDGQVSFTWRDYREGGKTKTITLSADEFIRRFLQHTVPDGSTASATSASSPTAIAPRSSHSAAGCSPCRRPSRRRRAAGRIASAISPVRTWNSVRTAAAACRPLTLYRPSQPATRGATAHDVASIALGYLGLHRRRPVAGRPAQDGQYRQPARRTYRPGRLAPRALTIVRQFA